MATREQWRDLCLRLARHINNPDEIDLLRWSANAMDLLVECRQLAPKRYDRKVKRPTPVTKKRK